MVQKHFLRSVDCILNNVLDLDRLHVNKKINNKSSSCKENLSIPPPQYAKYKSHHFFPLSFYESASLLPMTE